MGPHPHMVKNCANRIKPWRPSIRCSAPINPRLMMLYDRLDDRVALIHDCMSARRLREAQREARRAILGRRSGARGLAQHGEPLLRDGRLVPSPQPVSLRVPDSESQGAVAHRCRNWARRLLAAFEKGDAEFLASVRARQERELAHLNRRVREDAVARCRLAGAGAGEDESQRPEQPQILRPADRQWAEREREGLR